MKIVKCENEHYYDGDKYEYCPHCEEMGKEENSIKMKFDITESATEALYTEECRENLSDNEKTVAYYSDFIKNQPVVGWLVCVKGVGQGESYILKAGRNFVGRDSNMDVVLYGDRTVSRQKHAVITYDPKSRRFIAQPGESKELFYVNNEVVLSNVILNAFDLLEIGNSKLIFVPFCGERFCWEEITEKQ